MSARTAGNTETGQALSLTFRALWVSGLIINTARLWWGAHLRLCRMLGGAAWIKCRPIMNPLKPKRKSSQNRAQDFRQRDNFTECNTLLFMITRAVGLTRFAWMVCRSWAYFMNRHDSKEIPFLSAHTNSRELQHIHCHRINEQRHWSISLGPHAALYHYRLQNGYIASKNMLSVFLISKLVYRARNIR